MNRFIIILLALVAFSCTRKFYVAPKMAECALGGRNQCYLIKSSMDGNWIMIAEDIVGFELEEGYLYRILVKKIKVVDDFGNEQPAYEIEEILLKEPYKPKKSIDVESSIKDSEYTLARLVVNGKNIELPEEDIVLQFNTGKNQVSGNSGCNNFKGNYEIVGVGAIKFGELASTRKMCADSKIQQFEDAFLKVLQEAHSFNSSDDELTFSNASGDLMEFYLD